VLVFIDANILIYRLEAVPGLGARASARLATLHAAGDRIAVSDLVRLECRVGPLKSADAALLADYDTLDMPVVRSLRSRDESSRISR